MIASMQSSLQSAMNIRPAFGMREVVFVIGMICLAVSVYLAVAIGDVLREAGLNSAPELRIGTNSSVSTNLEKASLESYSIIQTHRVFAPPQEPRAPTEAPKRPTPLKLRLVAVNEMSGGSKLAIIEDTQKNEQDVFDTNEAVFEQGKLVEILSDQVKIEHNGRIETLELGEPGSTQLASLSAGGAPSPDQTDFTVPEAELTQALQNLPQLLSQARAVPYFRNGESIGMRLFAIRSGSLYEKLGLKNGDIVLAVNNNSLSDPTQALKLFEQLKSERSVSVKVERNSQPVDLRYSIQ